ncbi:hypothetical protein QVD17_33973 [Tagetes erecta]|uniref:S-protein homolog n=1 Tax=Tagetes erecta TaxID=13708 RepID=A0AAD8JX80_TARER|nr:hypothetical protein QVD17_33973 [Tagetes erecta]
MSNLKKLLFSFMVMFYFTCFLITPSYSLDCYAQEWTVYIYDGIQDSVIDVHVKSKDDDLGHHNITFDLGYRFAFCESIFGNTLFTGDFYHGSQFVHFNVFDDVVSSIIGGPQVENTNVYWLLKQDGYYLSKEFKAYHDPVWKFMGHWQ